MLGVLATARGAFPKPLAEPLIVIPLFGSYQADMAYGSKMRRVVLQAE